MLRALGAIAGVVLMASPALAAWEKWEDSWGKCELARQCVAVQAPCGAWKAVSRGHLKDAKEYFDHQKMLVKCQQVPHPEPTLACEKQQCVTMEQGNQHE